MKYKSNYCGPTDFLWSPSLPIYRVKTVSPDDPVKSVVYCYRKCVCIFKCLECRSEYGTAD